MTANYPLHLIPLLPFLGAAFALLFGRKVGKNVITLTSLGVVAASFLVAAKGVWLLHHTGASTSLIDTFFSAPWIKAGDIDIAAGLVLDHLSSVMVLIVTGIGLLIHIYSTAYMEHDERYTTFFGYLNLFMGSMLILVLGDSMLVTFVGWEGVGLCSYLLIGFWFDKEAFASAGRKAFVVNRIGDFGFLLAMFLLFSATGTLKYGALDRMIDPLSAKIWLAQPVATFIGLLVLLGATGKSAQIPLYVWLPDAMAGPTPVSALIHAATMVTAGVYVVARMHVVYTVGSTALVWVAVIGALTALFAATIGFAQKDMKKVLAYSTVSQLGFMFVGVGSSLETTSNYHGGIFHLMTHAFFKAGLFLGAGSVMHAMSGEGDITRMGGLKRWIPHTRWTFLICCIAIAGIPPFAGFWSKDAILAGIHAAKWSAMSHNPYEMWFAAHLGTVLYFVLLAAAFCTAFYMFRLYFLVFTGEFRGTEEEKKHIHESPPAMTVVLWILAIGAMVTGFLGVPDALWHDILGDWLEPAVAAQARHETAGGFLVAAGIATAVALAGIGFAALLYWNKGFSEPVKKFVAAVPRLYKLVFNKYKIDELYDWTVVKPVRWTALLLWKVVDSFLIDTVVVRGLGALVNGLGKIVRYVQNGDPQRYVVGILVGVAAIFYVVTHVGARNASHFRVQVEGKTVTVSTVGTGPSDSRIQYRVDWDGKHKYSDLQKTTVFRHTYDTAGKKHITIEAFDDRWDTTATRSQTVVLP